MRELSFNGIYLNFGEKDQLPKSPLVETKPLGQADKISEQAEKQQLAFVVEQGLEELRLTDPLAYEKLIEGELEDVD